MLYQYEIYQNKFMMYLKPKAEVSVENIYPHTKNIFEIMTLLKDGIGIGKFTSEHLYAIGCNNSGNILGLYLVSEGSETECYFDYNNIICFLNLIQATQVILVHNHPDRNLMPSEADYENTYEIISFLNKFNFQLIGNYVITEDGFINTFDNNKEMFV